MDKKVPTNNLRYADDMAENIEYFSKLITEMTNRKR